MDVDGLRKELEEHLKANPDENAPSGFRDRFESALEQMASDDGIPDEIWEAQLQRIRNEAEAAAKSACDDGDPPPPKKELDGGDEIKPPAVDSGGGNAGTEGRDSAAFLRRFALPLGVAAIALAAAYFAFRS
jgi:hypothetical protein